LASSLTFFTVGFSYRFFMLSPIKPPKGKTGMLERWNIADIKKTLLISA